MASSSNKYENAEKLIDESLSAGKIYIFPPGFMLFMLVNMLLIFGSTMLVLTIQDVVFNNIETAMVFTVSMGVVMAFVIVTPPFFIIWGYRKAYFFLKLLVIALSLFMSVFTSIAAYTGSKLLPLSFSGLICMVVIYFLVISPTYIVFSLFTARRRELAIEKKTHEKKLFSK